MGVAFSGRQILVTYLSGHGYPTLRRGLHFGSQWTQPDVRSTSLGFIPLAAHGKDVVAIVNPKLELLSRDSGQTWQRVTDPLEAGSGHVNLAWNDGMWRVAYYDKALAIRYRASSDAVHWSTSEVVATESAANDVDVYGVAAAGTPLVLVATITGA